MSLLEKLPLGQIVNAVVDCIISRIVQNYDLRAETEMVDGKFVTRLSVEDRRAQIDIAVSRNALLS